MMMISIACAWAETVGASKVFHGAALVDSQAGYWDGSQEFLNTINKVTALNRRTRISVEAPLIEMSKAQIIRYGIELQVDFSRTWTCYEGKEFACGYCTACSSRIKGFLDNGMKDPVQYERSINW
jgi:7-cyano-7-deazaguanine synthase